MRRDLAEPHPPRRTAASDEAAPRDRAHGGRTGRRALPRARGVVAVGQAAGGRLARRGMAVREWDADAALIERLRTERPDAVVVALHGGEGENGSVQAVLELLGVPFVGTSATACRRAWDKPTAKAELARAGLDTPDWVALPHATFRELGARAVLDAMVERLGLPLMLKPDQGGSALGAQVVAEAADLPAAMVSCLAYADTVLAERFVQGTEVAVSVVEDDTSRARCPRSRWRRRAASTTTPPATRPARPSSTARPAWTTPSLTTPAGDRTRRTPAARPAGRVADGRRGRHGGAGADPGGERLARA